jgi:hypothetical protein
MKREPIRIETRTTVEIARYLYFVSTHPSKQSTNTLIALPKEQPVPLREH